MELKKRQAAARKFQYPLARYRVNSDRFKTPCYERGHFRGIHLGEDVDRKAGTPVSSIGSGIIVYVGLHPGTRKKGGWGNIVIIRHSTLQGKPLYSLYGHLARVRAKKGQKVEKGERIGVIAPGNTAGNGYWEDAHLHFAIYTGPWRGRSLPGFLKKSKTGKANTRLAWWREPTLLLRAFEAKNHS